MTEKQIEKARNTISEYQRLRQGTPGARVMSVGPPRMVRVCTVFAEAAAGGWPAALDALEEARRERDEESEVHRVVCAEAVEQRRRAEDARGERDEAVRMYEATVAEAVEQRRRAESAEKERDEARRMFCRQVAVLARPDAGTPLQVAERCWPTEADRLFP